MKVYLRNLTQTKERTAVWTVLEMVGLRGPSVSISSPISVTMAWCHVPKTNPSVLGEVARLTAKCSVSPWVIVGHLWKFEYGRHIIQICRLCLVGVRFLIC